VRSTNALVSEVFLGEGEGKRGGGEWEGEAWGRRVKDTGPVDAFGEERGAVGEVAPRAAVAHAVHPHVRGQQSVVAHVAQARGHGGGAGGGNGAAAVVEVFFVVAEGSRPGRRRQHPTAAAAAGDGRRSENWVRGRTEVVVVVVVLLLLVLVGRARVGGHLQRAHHVQCRGRGAGVDDRQPKKTPQFRRLRKMMSTATHGTARGRHGAWGETGDAWTRV